MERILIFSSCKGKHQPHCLFIGGGVGTRLVTFYTGIFTIVSVLSHFLSDMVAVLSITVVGCVLLLS